MDTLSSWSKPLPSTFSLQDALVSYQYSSVLFASGCNQTDGVANCTATCTDPTQAFRTLENLHNCLLYVGIADLYARQNLSSNATELADRFVIQKGNISSPISQTVNNTITACLGQYCRNSTDCTRLMWSSRWESTLKQLDANPYYPEEPSQQYYSYDLRYNIYDFSSYSYGTVDYPCGYIAPSYPLNPDIGGIGVYASYWIQAGLALLGTFLVLLWGWRIHYACLPSRVGRVNDAAKRAQGESVTFENRRLASLTAALTEFQKAQCFFMLAINIAALANKANGGLLPVSLQQLYDSYLLLASVSISGYLPITATLLALHMVDMISAYLLALSGCTVALSIATAVAVGVFKPSRGDLNSIQAQVAKGTLSECADLDLTVYCLRSQYSDTINTSNSSVWGIMAYCIIVLSYIFAYHLNAFRDPLKSQTRPWVLRFASWLSSIRSLQLALTIPITFTEYGPFTWVLAILTLAYIVSPLAFRLRCARKIKIKESMSVKCGVDLLAWVLWLAGFASSPGPLSFLSFLIWATFTISTFQLLRKAYIEDTKIRKWAFKYRQLGYQDETLASSSLGVGSIRMDLRISFTIMIKASITLVTLISMRIEKLEKRAASHDWPRKYRRFLVIFLYWIIFLGCIVCFAFDFLGLASFQTKVDHQTWTFGQIVAITVWTPPLCEYFHLELRGMKRGFQHRLLPPYTISSMDSSARPVPDGEVCKSAKDHDADIRIGDVMSDTTPSGAHRSECT